MNYQSENPYAAPQPDAYAPETEEASSEGNFEITIEQKEIFKYIATIESFLNLPDLNNCIGNGIAIGIVIERIRGLLELEDIKHAQQVKILTGIELDIAVNRNKLMHTRFKYMHQCIGKMYPQDIIALKENDQK